MKIPSAINNLMSQFEGKFVQLSKQKFSSHVVEKCIKDIEKSRSIIIRELVADPKFHLLLQDPYANYVIHSAINYTKVSISSLLLCNPFEFIK